MAYATYTLLPIHVSGKISAKKGGGLILRHRRIIRILRYLRLLGIRASVAGSPGVQRHVPIDRARHNGRAHCVIS